MPLKKNYCIIKKAVGLEVCNFLCDYLDNKREIYKILVNNKHISMFDSFHGNSENKDTQRQNGLDTYSVYGDAALDTLLVALKKTFEEKEKEELIPTYSFARVYTTGEILYKHLDRPSCTISGTLFLGGDNWEIFLRDKDKKIKVNLNQGDILMYYGDKLPHWRDQFIGNECFQVFLHYNKKNDPNSSLYDGRLFIGVPNYVR